MKIRRMWVSNSSTSSFVIKNKTNKNISNIELKKIICQEIIKAINERDIDDNTRKHELKNFKNAKSCSEFRIATMYKTVNKSELNKIINSMSVDDEVNVNKEDNGNYLVAYLPKYLHKNDVITIRADHSGDYHNEFEEYVYNYMSVEGENEKISWLCYDE